MSERLPSRIPLFISPRGTSRNQQNNSSRNSVSNNATNRRRNIEPTANSNGHISTAEASGERPRSQQNNFSQNAVSNNATDSSSSFEPTANSSVHISIAEASGGRPRNQQNNSSLNAISNNDVNGSSSSEGDFIGRPRSNRGSSTDRLSLNAPGREASLPNASVDQRNITANSSGQISTAEASRSRRSRKQNAPKKNKDHVLHEIYRLQSSTTLLLQRAPFQRVVREILQTHGEYRMTSKCLEALQESSEMYLVQLFEDCVYACIHRARVTVNAKDMQLIQTLRGSSDPGSNI